MARVIVTNNEKVNSAFADKAEVILLNGAPAQRVLKEGRKLAESGGRLLTNPARNGNKRYFRSLVFYSNNDMNTPDEKTLSLLDRCIAEAGEKSMRENKKSIISSLLQNRDLNEVKSVVK